MAKPVNSLNSVISFAVAVLIFSSSALIFGSVVIRLLGLDANSSRLLSALWGAAAIFGVGLFLARWQRLNERGLGLVHTSMGPLVAAGFLGLCLSPLLGLLAAEIRGLVHGDVPNPQIEQLFLAQGTPIQWFFLAMMVVIAIPLAEEFLYRGVLFGFVACHTSDRWAIWVTAIIFGIAHYDIANSVGTGILGLALGWFRSQTGSIWPGVCLHAGFNLFGFILIMIPLSNNFGT